MGGNGSGRVAEIIYVRHDGARHQVDVAIDRSVMEGAVDNGVPGILADCGGACSCATCHVYIDEEWRQRVGGPNEIEEAMLQLAIEPRENSRLSCQIKIRAEFDGLVVHLPATQV